MGRSNHHISTSADGTTMYKEKRSKANCTCRKKNQARVKNTSSKEFIPGGSKLLMVCQISYFEFLIITRFKLPTIEPRLPLWSTNMLNSYVALNVLHGKSNEYSRLLIKHISYTIFSDSAFVELPEEMLRVY
ncbi:uncharacterized protein [Aegilops tauschii subsp. strangulata]|uniref:Uncharacterized protein n=1 Tax=Aegilops tauschii subsp. strangulata TaxID=200361 RepID=A0A453BIY8_AEGTS